MTDTNGPNGHPASLGDVLGRVGKLETSVAKLETGMVSLQNDMHRIETGQGQILTALSNLDHRQATSGRPNWMLVVGIVGVSITFVTAIGGLFISPLRASDAYHERDIAELQKRHNESIERLQTRLASDHDMIVILKDREEQRTKQGK